MESPTSLTDDLAAIALLDEVMCIYAKGMADASTKIDPEEVVKFLQERAVAIVEILGEWGKS